MKKTTIIFILVMLLVIMVACEKDNGSIVSTEQISRVDVLALEEDSEDASFSVGEATNVSDFNSSEVGVENESEKVKLLPNERDLPVFSDDKNINHQYYEDIIRLVSKGVLPDGATIYNDKVETYEEYKTKAYPDEIAVSDIDSDGINELLIRVGGTGATDNILYVYAFDCKVDKFELLFQMPAREKFYEGNIICIDDYKREYNLYYDGFYPYTYCSFDKSEIVPIAHVEQMYLTEDNYIEKFPQEYDMNHNNVIYKVSFNNPQREQYYDDAEYQEWTNKEFVREIGVNYVQIAN